jgi:hypothetical protein
MPDTPRRALVSGSPVSVASMRVGVTDVITQARFGSVGGVV